MSAMRVLRFASAARAGSVSSPSSLWRPTKPARSQNARFSLAHRLAATFPGAGNGMSAMRVLRLVGREPVHALHGDAHAVDDVFADVVPRQRVVPCLSV